MMYHKLGGNEYKLVNERTTFGGSLFKGVQFWSEQVLPTQLYREALRRAQKKCKKIKYGYFVI